MHVVISYYFPSFSFHFFTSCARSVIDFLFNFQIYCILTVSVNLKNIKNFMFPKFFDLYFCSIIKSDEKPSKRRESLFDSNCGIHFAWLSVKCNCFFHALSPTHYSICRTTVNYISFCASHASITLSLALAHKQTHTQTHRRCFRLKKLKKI